MTISGAIFTNRFICQNLTEYIYLGGPPFLNDRIYEIAKVLRALKLCLGELRSFYTDLSPLPSNPSVRGKASKNPRRPLHTSRPVAGSFPHFKSFKVGDREFRLEYVERLVPGELEKAVFKAVLRYEGQTTDVVVKFTPTYCVRAHQIAWGKQSAPKLWYCRHEESVRMFVVVMDFVKGRHVDDLTDLPEKVLKQLRATIETLHAEKIVFGDLRGPNVMVADDGQGGKRGMLLDFDWAGEEGVALYPVDINMDAGWHWDVKGGGPILAEHDLFMLGCVEQEESEVEQW